MIRIQPSRILGRIPALISLSLFQSGYLVAATSLGAQASGFSGEFQESSWMTVCATGIFQSCGRVNPGNNQLATVYPDDPIFPSIPGNHSDLVTWVNSAGRTSAYRVSFTLDFSQMIHLRCLMRFIRLEEVRLT